MDLRSTGPRLGASSAGLCGGFAVVGGGTLRGQSPPHQPRAAQRAAPGCTQPQPGCSTAQLWDRASPPPSAPRQRHPLNGNSSWIAWGSSTLPCRTANPSQPWNSWPGGGAIRCSGNAAQLAAAALRDDCVQQVAGVIAPTCSGLGRSHPWATWAWWMSTSRPWGQQRLQALGKDWLIELQR